MEVVDVKPIMKNFALYGFSTYIDQSEESLEKSFAKISEIGKMSPRHVLLAYMIIDKFGITDSLTRKNKPIPIFSDEIKYQDGKNISEIIKKVFSDSSRKDFDVKLHKIEILAYIQHILESTSSDGGAYLEDQGQYFSPSPSVEEEEEEDESDEEGEYLDEDEV